MGIQIYQGIGSLSTCSNYQRPEIKQVSEEEVRRQDQEQQQAAADAAYQEYLNQQAAADQAAANAAYQAQAQADAQAAADAAAAAGDEAARQEAQAQADRIQAQREAEYREKAAGLDAEYQKMIDELEPKFVDTITGIYEHIFHVDLHSYREVLCYLISATMRNTEDNKSFLIHVSKEDYPYVSMQKKQITAQTASPNASVEIIEDMTLGKGECLIETEGGIFDCGLGTQLAELRQKLKLLSYEG